MRQGQIHKLTAGNCRKGNKAVGKNKQVEEGLDGSLTTERLLWTYDELAMRSMIARSTLEKWVHYGKLTHPAVLKLGRSVRFDPAKVMARLREIGAEYVS